MATSISDKLKIRSKATLLTLNAPDDFRKQLAGLPSGVKITNAGNEYDQVHWFVMNMAQLEKEMSKVMKLVKVNVIVWVYYPKRTSKIQSDLTRDHGWDCLLKEDDKLTWISLISFNDTWSVFGFRARTDADRINAQKPKAQREILKYADAKTKKILLPVDLAVALKNNKNQALFFDSLSFTNKKEYVEWIVTAKREKTRKDRIIGTIARLAKGWKNPGNS